MLRFPALAPIVGFVAEFAIVMLFAPLPLNVSAVTVALSVIPREVNAAPETVSPAIAKIEAEIDNDPAVVPNTGFVALFAIVMLFAPLPLNVSAVAVALSVMPREVNGPPDTVRPCVKFFPGGRIRTSACDAEIRRTGLVCPAGISPAAMFVYVPSVFSLTRFGGVASPLI